MNKFLVALSTALFAGSIFAADGDLITLTDKINALDAEVTQTAAAGNGWISGGVTEVDGKITGFSVTIDGTKYEAAGSINALRTEIIGKASDTSASNTIYGVKAYVDEKVAVQDITIAEGTTDGTISVKKGSAAASDIPVHGLGSAAFEDTTAFDAAGAAAAVQGNTSSTVKDVEDAAAAAQATADAAVVANTAITGATHTKITYDEKGLVTDGADLAASDIPALDASKITTGTFDDEFITSAAIWNAKQDQIIAGTNVVLGADNKTINVTMNTADIEAVIIRAMTIGITYQGHNYKLVVDLAE